VKAGSSKWMHEQTGDRRFEWQEGYGAFTIGASQVSATIRYIDNQPTRHRKIGLKEKWEPFLRRRASFLNRD
jgi:putative transposase